MTIHATVLSAYLRGVSAAQNDITLGNWQWGEFAANHEMNDEDRYEWRRGYDSVMKPFLERRKAA